MRGGDHTLCRGLTPSPTRRRRSPLPRQLTLSAQCGNRPPPRRASSRRAGPSSPPGGTGRHGRGRRRAAVLATSSHARPAATILCVTYSRRRGGDRHASDPRRLHGPPPARAAAASSPAARPRPRPGRPGPRRPRCRVSPGILDTARDARLSGQWEDDPTVPAAGPTGRGCYDAVRPCRTGLHHRGVARFRDKRGPWRPARTSPRGKGPGGTGTGRISAPLASATPHVREGELAPPPSRRDDGSGRSYQRSATISVGTRKAPFPDDPSGSPFRRRLTKSRRTDAGK